MRTAAVIASLIICCGIAPPSGLAARLIPAPRAKLASYDWSAKASPNLSRNPPSKRIVEAFVRSIEVSVYGLSSIGDREGGDEICSYAFADLRHNGFLSLVFGKGVIDRP